MNTFERTVENVTRWLGFIAIALLFAVLTLRAHQNVTDEDTLLHIRTGQYIVQHGVPTTEIFSFSMAGQPWIDHQWLWQVIVYAVYKVFGGNGIVALQVFFALSMYSILLFFGYRKDRIFLVVGLLFMGMLVEPVRTLVRPDIVSLWFALVEISILWLFLKESWSVYPLFILQVLWVNIHGFFIFGPVFVLLIWLAESAKRFIPLPYEWNSTGRLADDEYYRLLKIWAALLAACFINPQFIDGFLYPFKIMFGDPHESKFMFSYIGELHRSVPNYWILSLHYRPYYKLLIIISSAGFILNWRRIDLRVFGLWLFFLCFSWGANRNLLFFPPAAYLSVMHNISHMKLDGIMPVTKGKFILRHAILIALLTGLIVWIGATGKKMMAFRNFDYDANRFQSAYGRLSIQKYPVKAQAFLVENKIHGNFFNSLGVGHFLISQNFPDIKVYIDGRTEVYGAEFYKTYQKIFEQGDWEAFQKQVEELNIAGIFVCLYPKPIPTEFLQAISSHVEWRPVYFDYDALVYLRDIPSNREHINRLAFDLSEWPTQQVSGQWPPYPEAAIPYFYRAKVLNGLGYDEQAANEAAEALKLNPSHIDTINLIAQLEMAKGHVQQAVNFYRRALDLSPRSITLMSQLVKGYEKARMYEEAIPLCRKMIQQAPKDSRGHFALSRVLAGMKRYAQSFEALKTGSQLNSSPNESEILAVAGILYDQKAYDWAEQTCDVAKARAKGRKETAENVEKICSESQVQSIRVMQEQDR